MTKEQRERLRNRDSEYLSIGITEGGLPRMAIGIPWKFTSNAYRMETPNVYIAAEDLDDPDVMADISRYKVIGCYISVCLEDYSFLEDFPYLRDLSIKQGDKLSDLSFMRKLLECKMLYIRDAKLKNLDDIIETKKQEKSSYVTCLCLDNCYIEDLSSVLENERLAYSEFIVAAPCGSGEKERWSGFKERSRRFEFYEYVPK